jgi:hypothetical protein
VAIFSELVTRRGKPLVILGPAFYGSGFSAARTFGDLARSDCSEHSAVDPSSVPSGGFGAEDHQIFSKGVQRPLEADSLEGH